MDDDDYDDDDDDDDDANDDCSYCCCCLCKTAVFLLGLQRLSSPDGLVWNWGLSGHQKSFLIITNLSRLMSI